MITTVSASHRPYPSNIPIATVEPGSTSVSVINTLTPRPGRVRPNAAVISPRMSKIDAAARASTMLRPSAAPVRGVSTSAKLSQVQLAGVDGTPTARVIAALRRASRGRPAVAIR